MSRVNRILIVVIVIAVLLVMIVPNTVRNDDKGRDNINMTLVLQSKYGHQWEQIQAGANAAASEYGIDLTVFAPDSANEAEAQSLLLTAAMDAGTEAIILAPINYSALTQEVQEMSLRGIPLILVATETEDVHVITNVHSRNYEIGKMLAEAVVRSLGQEGSVILINVDDAASDYTSREKGFVDYIQEISNIRVALPYYVSQEEVSARQRVQIILENNEVDMVVGLEDITTTAIGQLLDEYEYDIMSVGCNLHGDSTRYIEQGYFESVIYENFFAMGYLSVVSAMGNIKGNVNEANIYVDAHVVNEENLYSEEMQMIVFPLR